MQIGEFEQAVLEIEEIVIRIRAKTNEEIGDYDYDRKAKNKMSVTRWLSTRINPKLNGHQVSVIDGHNFNSPHGKTTLGTLRDTYNREEAARHQRKGGR